MKHFPRGPLFASLLASLALTSACTTSSPLSPALSESSSPAIFLLGEVHDNPDGHRRRLEFMRAKVEAGWRPAIAMEQFDRERQADLDRAMARCTDAACVIAAAAPANARWDWPLYTPVIELALQYRLPLVAANLSRADAGKVMREGFAAALDRDTISRFALDRQLPADMFQKQKQAVMDGHCNKLPASMADGLVRAQAARDVWMAKAVEQHAARGVILLAGNGHVRRDVGVPQWLPPQQRGGVRSIGYVEELKAEPAGMYDDMIAITPHARPDPCAKL
ncbi:hypothetical protein D3870_00560 [Noviherbaspirillum cavernae]|uniref:Haem-binding uptake Tiki superfamily ChaN domain-containing protein n=1 Tax=Noviherbaspirillum cavernae TaxID=2320862 RepID=A0A418WWU1_9BURK|nr:ChaN family lipoprotein [Noviherbaspirillum cavernae]RJG04710.1 hypothetical protein D3870_00560 [Noviherbaspirillum cavernae]